MADFEIIVRPAILPNIRPARQPRMPTPAAAADQNMVVLSGGNSGAKWVDLTTSTSYSMSRQKHIETKRTFDVERIYRKDDDDKVDKSQYVDVERVKKVETRDGTGVKSQTVYAKPPDRDNVKILETGVVRSAEKGSAA
jgi:hypothetical protein